MGKKSKRKLTAAMEPARPPGGLAAAIRWPIYEVVVSRNWDQEAALVTVLVARQSPAGKIAIALFLVDLGCLGVKSAIVRTLPGPAEYREFRANLALNQPLERVELDLAAKIVDAGAAYAADLGFKPDPVFHQAKYLLSDANPDACPVQIPLGGPEGKPLFVSGPFDNAARIVEHLTQRVGEGNFHVMVGVDSLDGLEPEDLDGLPRL